MAWRYDPLDFESGVFGAPVGRVVADASGRDLASLADGWRRDGVWLVSARIPAEDHDGARALADAGFVNIERLVTLERPLIADEDVPEGVRLATDADRAACLDVARTAFSHDRFHADDRVPDDRADTLKETWVANSLDGRADAVLVADHMDRAAGFVTCMVGEGYAVIDLIAVSPESQGHGLGPKLVAGACAHYGGRFATMRVGTQETNTRSLAMYERQGFVRVSAADTYHWINAEAAP